MKRADYTYSNSAIKAFSAEYIHSERDRMIFDESMCNQLPYERIAERVGLSSRQVGNIVRRWRAAFQNYSKDFL